MLNVNTIIQLHCTVAGKIPVNKISKERMYLAAYTGSIYVYIYVCVCVCQLRSYLNEKVAAPGLENRRLTAVGTRCADHVTPLYPHKLALTSPTGGGRSVGIVRSRTKAPEFIYIYICVCVCVCVCLCV